MSITISKQAIEAFLDNVETPSTTETYLPATLPLTFTTPVHYLNTLSTLHLVAHLLSDPTHLSYFAATQTSAIDTATRGVLGLYLSSSEDWGKDNYLSAESWRSGSITESLISSMFRVEVMTEEDHESIPGIKVGKRWSEGTRVVQALVDGLRDAGERIKGRCLGEVVRGALEISRKETGPVEDFATSFLDRAVEFLPCLNDPYPSPDIPAWPAAPLRLLQDLSTLKPTTQTLDIDLPDPSELADISPLPIPLEPLLQAGILQLSDVDPAIQDALSSASPKSKAQTAAVPLGLYLELMRQSVVVCRDIYDISRQSRRTPLSMASVPSLFKSSIVLVPH